MNTKEIAVVYMVAGLSSRFGGKIKQFAKVSEKDTLIEYSVKQAIKAGFSKIIFIVGNKTEQGFKEMFGSEFCNILVDYAYQKFDSSRDKPWGTCDALCSAIDLLDYGFVVCNGDDIYGENTFKILAEHLQSSDKEATIGYKLINVLPEKGEVHRGIFKVENNYVSDINETLGISKENLKLKNLSENDFCSQNIFALHPETARLLNEKLIKFKEENKGDRKKECYLPTELANLIKDKKIKMKVYSTPDKWLGITNPEDEEIVRNELKNR